MGHDSERGRVDPPASGGQADKLITDATDVHVQAERDEGGDEDGPAGTPVPAR